MPRSTISEPALDWALAEKHDVVTGAGLAAALWPYWFELGTSTEGRRYIEAALALHELLEPHVVALLWFGHATTSFHSWTAMLDSAAHAIRTYEELGDRAAAMRATVSHAEALLRLGNYAEADKELDTALAFFRTGADQRWASYAISALARNALWQGNIQTRKAALYAGAFGRALAR